jgi:carbonic anhydrase
VTAREPSREVSRRRFAVVTCMDGRVPVHRFDGLAGSEVHIIRNAGGRTSDDVIRSLVVAWRVLGVQEFIVVHHTECRMMATTNEALRADLTYTVHVDTSALDFLVFDELRASVEEDVHLIRGSPYLADLVPVSGFVWDLRASRLESVVVDPRSRLRGTVRARRDGTLPLNSPRNKRSPISVPTGGIWRLGG